MKNRIKLVGLVLVCLLVLPLLLACAKAPSATPAATEKVITVGYLNDLSGAISCCGIADQVGLKNYLQYIQDEKRIPGVKFDVVSWDDRYDVSRVAAGYRYLLDKGVNLIVTMAVHQSETMRPMAVADKMLILGYNTSELNIADPIWCFTQQPLTENANASFFNWVTQNWDYQKTGRKPVVAEINWDNSMGKAGAKGAEAYCKSLPDKLDWKGTIVVPPGTMDFSQPALQLNQWGCDYVFSTMVNGPTTNLMKEKNARGYKFQVCTGGWGFVCFKQSKDVGGKDIDGLYWISAEGWHTDGTAGLKLADTICRRYNSASDIEKLGYLENICYNFGLVFGMEVEFLVKGAISAGLDPTNSEVLRGQATKMKIDPQGLYPPMTWSNAKGSGVDKLRMYQIKLVNGVPEPALITDWFDVTKYKK